MFNLEQAIADWRRQMLAAGIDQPEPLAELESHLRDDVDQRLQAGAEVQLAFETAVQHVGQAHLLKQEFARAHWANQVPVGLKRSLLAFAGVPIHYPDTNMNTPSSNLDSRWATYLRAAAFLLPAASLWFFACMFLMPKLRQVCMESGIAVPAAFNAALLATQYYLPICVALVVGLVLLEWRSAGWPHYRRAAVGIGVFVLNSIVLLLITAMAVLALVVAAPGKPIH